jgi:hypothetical protein
MRCASELDSKNFLAHDAMIRFFLKGGFAHAPRFS